MTIQVHEIYKDGNYIEAKISTDSAEYLPRMASVLYIGESYASFFSYYNSSVTSMTEETANVVWKLVRLKLTVGDIKGRRLDRFLEYKHVLDHKSFNGEFELFSENHSVSIYANSQNVTRAFCQLFGKLGETPDEWYSFLISQGFNIHVKRNWFSRVENGELISYEIINAQQYKNLGYIHMDRYDGCGYCFNILYKNGIYHSSEYGFWDDDDRVHNDAEAVEFGTFVYDFVSKMDHFSVIKNINGFDGKLEAYACEEFRINETPIIFNDAGFFVNGACVNHIIEFNYEEYRGVFEKNLRNIFDDLKKRGFNIIEKNPI